MNNTCIKLTIFSIVCFVSWVEADVLLPDWAGEADSSVLYVFPDSSTNPSPTSVSNPFGTVVATISQGTLGSAAGWLDPNLPWYAGITRGTGAWNINDDGYIQIDVPVEDGSLMNYELELWIDAVAYDAPTLVTLPEISVSGSVLESTISDEFLEEDEFGDWRHNLWKGTILITSADKVSVNILGTSGTSNIDQVAIYARAVPEPAVITLIIGASATLLFVKKRFMD